ncbi:MAG: PD-(D/E)XK nuclease family protein [Betaproteobacteria bacterium]
MNDALARALAEGATVVTPNRRLARHLTDAHDGAQRAVGKRAWTAATVLPWPAWMRLLDSEVVGAGAAPARARLGDHASSALWRDIVASDEPAPLDVAGLAASAEGAWVLVHTFGSGGESWRAWAGRDDEPAVFARWAERYRAACDELRAVDPASVPNRVAQAAGAMPAWRGRPVVLAGFTALTPVERRVVEALRGAGMAIDACPTVEDVATVPSIAAFASPGEEIAAALDWARAAVEARPQRRIGIVVPDLSSRLAAVRRAARERLGAPDGDGVAPAWNVSLGAALDEAPVVAAALDLLALAWSSLPVGHAAAVIRSRHFADGAGDGRTARARVERLWLDAGMRHARLGDAIAALGAGDPWSERLVRVADLARRTRQATRHEWVDAWREALRIAGWPGDRSPSSAEYQAAGALDELWAAFATIDAVAGTHAKRTIGGDEAVRTLAEWAAATPFQTESPPAPIQILGLIESIGLPFDALWIAGMTDEAWPRAPRPHPLLPIRWQRERGVSRSDAAIELAWAQGVTAQWLGAASEVVVSHAPAPDARTSTCSALFSGGAAREMTVQPSAARRVFDARGPRERLRDPDAPPFAGDEQARAGASLVEAQSACPFQALAAMRWRADPWPSASIGLTLMERGTLVHATLDAFWRETKTHAALVALMADAPAFADRCDASARAALTTLRQDRLRRIPAAVRAGEAERLASQLRRWLETVERDRPPFSVLDTEKKLPLAIGALRLRLRIDRVDALHDGGVAIVDYKTGAVPAVARWIAPRPEATQIALYSLAWRQANPESFTAATVLAQLRPGGCTTTGYYASDTDRFTTAPKRQVVVDDWPAFEATRDAKLTSLAQAFARGVAEVAPRNRQECRRCRRQALCRIGDAADEPDEDER